MSNNLNINGSTDPSYRYKMPRVVGKVEGRGNGIKTVIVNATQVSQSLKRPSEHLTKFLGLQMGAQSRYDPQTDRAIVNGSRTLRSSCSAPSAGTPRRCRGSRGRRSRPS
jgi:translation initiation factor 5